MSRSSVGGEEGANAAEEVPEDTLALASTPEMLGDDAEKNIASAAADSNPEPESGMIQSNQSRFLPYDLVVSLFWLRPPCPVRSACPGIYYSRLVDDSGLLSFPRVAIRSIQLERGAVLESPGGVREAYD